MSGQEVGRRRNQGAQAIEVSEPHHWLGTFFASSSSNGMVFFNIGKSWSRVEEEEAQVSGDLLVSALGR